MYFTKNNDKKMLKYYRKLPFFKGKSKLGRILFKNIINKNESLEFTAHQNIKYKIPNTFESLGVELLITGIYENKIVRFLNSNIKSGDIYFDIGANIGALGLPVVKNQPNIKYVAFEASPIVYDYLKENFSINEIKNYELHNYVVHEDDNQAMKFYQFEKYGKSSLAPTFTEEYTFVDSISLDTFCIKKNVNKINWIKIDVQGFELFVFKGLQQLLRNKKVENILFEFEPWEEEAAGLEKGAAQNHLISLGYDLFDINGNKFSQIITDERTMIWAKPSLLS